MVKSERAFVDTNLFLRYLTDDVPDQADAVEDLLRRAGAGEITLITNSLVVAEIVWVLTSYYQQPPTEVRDKVLAVLNTPGLEVADGELVLQAVTWYTEENVDYIDAFNVAWLLTQGIDLVYTFDRRHFSRLEGIEVRTPGQLPA
jgi:predicted nucleic acid-binding protein